MNDTFFPFQVNVSIILIILDDFFEINYSKIMPLISIILIFPIIREACRIVQFLQTFDWLSEVTEAALDSSRRDT